MRLWYFADKRKKSSAMWLLLAWARKLEVVKNFQTLFARHMNLPPNVHESVLVHEFLYRIASPTISAAVRYVPVFLVGIYSVYPGSQLNRDQSSIWRLCWSLCRSEFRI